jgi:hypothetical protein
MEIDVKGSYGHLISHTFPGLLLGLELMIAFKLFTPFDGFIFLYSINYKIVNFLVILIVIFIISTILGIILDGVHHWLLRNYEDYSNYYEIYKLISNNTQMELCRQIDADYWYFYESFVNIALAMSPGILLIPILLFKMNINLWFIGIIWIIYLLIIFVLISEALYTLSIIRNIEKSLIDNFSKEKKGDAGTVSR